MIWTNTNTFVKKKDMKYTCSICGYVYDEEQQKIPFSELPDDWRCPLCGAAKSDFVAQVPSQQSVAKPSKTEKPSMANTKDEELQKLSVGQLSALCSNLARGCEKQYKSEEAQLFRELASYFESVTPAVKDPTVELMAKRLKEEISEYPSLNSTAKDTGDRGAQRVCVWGEKVTRMLSSLVERYLKEGETMLANTEIWICTVCGFVYIGKEAPQICPVCKVPSWKFEKM